MPKHWLRSLNIEQIVPMQVFWKSTLAQVFIYEKEKTFQHQINIKATVGGKIKMLSDYMSWVLLVQCTTYIDYTIYKRSITFPEYLRTIVLKCGSWTSSTSCTWELAEMLILRPHHIPFKSETLAVINPKSSHHKEKKLFFCFFNLYAMTYVH